MSMREQKQFDALEHMGSVFLKIALGLAVGFPVIWLLGIVIQPAAAWVILNVPFPLQPVVFICPVFALIGAGLLVTAAIRRRVK